MSSVMLPFDHKKVLPMAGVTFKSIAPLLPLHVAGDRSADVTGIDKESPTEKEATAEQLFISETVTPYIPCDRFCRSSADAPLDHKKE